MGLLLNPLNPDPDVYAIMTQPTHGVTMNPQSVYLHIW